jgi:hypothetical protein
MGFYPRAPRVRVFEGLDRVANAARSLEQGRGCLPVGKALFK